MKGQYGQEVYLRHQEEIYVAPASAQQQPKSVAAEGVGGILFSRRGAVGTGIEERPFN